MQAVRSVKQNYKPTKRILYLLEEFRKMVNDSIRVGLAENITSIKRLSKRLYHELSRYRTPACYRLTAMSKALGIIRNYRKAIRKNKNVKKPFAKRLMLTDCYGFSIKDGCLLFMVEPFRYHHIPLTPYTLRCISGYTVRSVCLTACTMSIAFSKETVMQTQLKGLIGIDRNLNNATTATLDGKTQPYDLSAITRIKAGNRETITHFKRGDDRIMTKIYRKYGQITTHKIQPLLHNTSKAIVEKAKAENFGIVMEDLKGIRKLYRKGNGQGTQNRCRMNDWSFYELQRQIEYKAKWEGIPVIYVKPHHTSSTCAICGSSVTECTERKVWCGNCMRSMDRDENAALNIVKRGLRFKPDGFAVEAMVKESNGLGNPNSRCEPINFSPKS